MCNTRYKHLTLITRSGSLTLYTKFFWSASGHSAHCWACCPVYQDTVSMVVHVSKLIHLRSVPTTDSTTGLLVNCHDTLVVQLSVSVTRSKGCNVISSVTGAIQIRSFTILLFALIIMLCDTCFTFQFSPNSLLKRQYMTELLHSASNKPRLGSKDPN